MHIKEEYPKSSSLITICTTSWFATWCISHFWAPKCCLNVASRLMIWHPSSVFSDSQSSDWPSKSYDWSPWPVQGVKKIQEIQGLIYQGYNYIYMYIYIYTLFYCHICTWTYICIYIYIPSRWIITGFTKSNLTMGWSTPAPQWSPSSPCDSAGTRRVVGHLPRPSVPEMRNPPTSQAWWMYPLEIIMMNSIGWSMIVMV